MIGAAGEGDRLFFILQQSRQFERAPPGQNQPLLFLHIACHLERVQGEPVAVGGHRAQAFPVHLEQHAVEVGAEVLGGHGEAGAGEQAGEVALAHRQRHVVEFVFELGEVVGGQGDEGEAAAPGLDEQLRAFKGNQNLGILRQCPANVGQFARGRCDPSLGGGIGHRHLGREFEFLVAAGQAERVSLQLKQQIGQYRQCAAPLDDSSNELQRLEQRIPRDLKLHDVFPGVSWLAPAAGYYSHLP